MTVGWETLDVGEQALVYNHEGEARIEEGPKRLFLWREKFQILKRNAVNQNSYAIVRYNDGQVEHLKGPCVIYENPLHHKFVKAYPMESLDANEALVVYKQDKETNKVTRYVQFGPTLFMPKAGEWLHEFCWHGIDPDNKTSMIPNSNRFSRLKIIPDQFYYNVDEVRTADDAAIRVKLMLFYELKDIDTMLNATKDPFSDFINCVCADIIAYASKYTYIEFMEKSSALNDLSNYPQLLDRSKQIGYEISKVVYRGFHTHDKLQKLHDGAVKTRTNLKIAYEKEEQEQEMTDMKLKNEKDRIQLEHKLEEENLSHKQELEKDRVRHKLMMELKQEQNVRDVWIQENTASLEGKKLQDAQTLKYYTNLHDLGVDLNGYIQAKAQRPQKIIKVVADKDSANFHLHHT
ncbi:uncharacterized protein LOC143067695 [Mytilus galloprovincialis]|uniref:uncharacterized protein n=1 Tax=Mytilus edulis TaxID=6550 RepID=UPI0039EFCF36